MKIAVIYSSKTGNTKKVARAIKDALPETTDLIEAKDFKGGHDYDFIFMGYWVDKGTADREAQKVMSQITNKEVAIFATLGAYPESDHARQSLVGAACCFGKNTKVVASYICQGAIDPKIIEMMRKNSVIPHGNSEESEKRWANGASRPDENDLKKAAEFAVKAMEMREIFAPYKEKIKTAMKEALAQDPGMPAMAAMKFGVSEKEVYENLPEGTVKFVDISNFKEIWEEMASWEKVQFLSVNSGLVMEVPGRLSRGKEGHGMFNLSDRDAPVHGHVIVDNLDSLAFVSIPFMGRESHNVTFFAKDGSVAFALYLGRNEKREIIPEVRESFLKLKESFS